MTSIANLKKSKLSRLQNLQKQIQDTTKKSYSDDRFWTLTMDKDTKVGKAIIRFIPSSEQVYEIREYSHSSQNKETEKWLIDICPTTVYGDREYHRCPICEARGKLMAEGSGSKEKADLLKRKIKYVSNIYVVKDYANPENDGKVFLYRYGPKIHEKIASMVAPEYDDEQPVDVFDFWDGRDFTLKTKAGQGGWPSYDDSSFGSKNCFDGMDDDELDAILSKTYTLNDLHTEETLTPYDKMKSNVARFFGEDSREQQSSKTKTADKKVTQDYEDDDIVPVKSKKEEKTVDKKVVQDIQQSDSTSDDDLMNEIDALLSEIEV